MKKEIQIMLKFACFSPHPPMLLPGMGPEEDKKEVQSTIGNLKLLGKKLHEVNPHSVIISSPHEDWGFNVPLHFLAPHFNSENIKPYLIGAESPQYYFEKGKKVFTDLEDKTYALIASGDLSHCLKETGPYGFNPQGPKFDNALIKALRKKDIKTILKLDNIFPQAGECGLRSFCFLLGILEASTLNWQPEILSYEAPFGVGYLVVNFQL